MQISLRSVSDHSIVCRNSVESLFLNVQALSNLFDTHLVHSAAMDSNEPVDSAELAHVRSYWANMWPNSPIYTFLLKDVELISASNGTVLAKLKVEPVHMNSKGTLHGTVSACITDSFGGLAIASTGVNNTGLSTDIHTTYVSTAKVGDTIIIAAVASKVGRCLAFTKVEIRHEAGAVVATGTHTKYVKE